MKMYGKHFALHYVRNAVSSDNGIAVALLQRYLNAKTSASVFTQHIAWNSVGKLRGVMQENRFLNEDK